MSNLSNNDLIYLVTWGEGHSWGEGEEFGELADGLNYLLVHDQTGTKC